MIKILIIKYFYPKKYIKTQSVKYKNLSKNFGIPLKFKLCGLKVYLNEKAEVDLKFLNRFCVLEKYIY